MLGFFSAILEVLQQSGAAAMPELLLLMFCVLVNSVSSCNLLVLSRAKQHCHCQYRPVVFGVVSSVIQYTVKCPNVMTEPRCRLVMSIAWIQTYCVTTDQQLQQIKTVGRVRVGSS